MNESVPKRTSPWKIVGIVVAVIVVSIVGLVVWASAAGIRKFERMREKSRAYLAEVRASDSRRPVLRGTAEKGNAWDDYLLAQAEVKKFAKANRLGEIVDRSPKADPEIAKEALAAHGAAVDLLRRGACRESSRYPYEWEQGVNMKTPGLMEAIYTTNIGVLKARALIAEGKPRDAAGVLLDVCQYGRDLTADGVIISYMVGTALLMNAFNDIRDNFDKFDPAALEDLDKGLEALDASFPNYGKTLMNEALLFGGLLNDSMTGGSGPTKLLHADAVERISDSMAAAAKAETLSWAEAQKELKRIETEASKAWNPISKIASSSMLQSGSIARQRRAQLRALRIGVHLKATGKTLDLDDPFGAKMRSEEKDGTVRIWSVGKDGVDDGGIGDWKSESKDVVLELKK